MPSRLPTIFCTGNADASYLHHFFLLSNHNYVVVALAVEAVIKISWYVYITTVTWCSHHRI